MLFPDPYEKTSSKYVQNEIKVLQKYGWVTYLLVFVANIVLII